MLKYNNFYKSQIENEKKFIKFLDFVEHTLCNPCWNHRRVEETDGKKEGYEKISAVDPMGKPHHSGGFLKLLEQEPKISKSDLFKWINDNSIDNLDHGFTHGLMVAFFYYDLYENKRKIHDNLHENNYECSKILYSCLFHDFVKIVKGEEPHDKLLEKVFKNCLNETYDHTNPKKESLLIDADRIELYRFKNNISFYKGNHFWNYY